jgi:hypothetical protein
MHEMLGFKENTLHDGWERKKILDDIKIESPLPLFKKLEDTVIEDENNRLMN